jgi:hypothetical protein
LLLLLLSRFRSALIKDLRFREVLQWTELCQDTDGGGGRHKDETSAPSGQARIATSTSMRNLDDSCRKAYYHRLTPPSREINSQSIAVEWWCNKLQYLCRPDNITTYDQLIAET